MQGFMDVISATVFFFFHFQEKLSSTNQEELHRLPLNLEQSQTTKLYKHALLENEQPLF